MKKLKKNQCIVVSGESGAGKTESARRLLQALAHGSAASTGGGDGSSAGGGNGGVGAEMQRLLLAATEVLEPLGSAFTARNPHSSRFGRLLSLSFTRRGGGGGGAAAAAGGELRAVGASVTAYLLERSRVAALPRGERCFHIVYQMLAAAERNSLPADVEKPSLKLQGRGTVSYTHLTLPTKA